jgi:3-hydroxyisobutyrate dehydrogenase-like beta-hydroxyacid dehydrogenase
MNSPTPDESDSLGGTAMNNELKIGFVGFGEAGYHIAKGLRGAGLSQIYCFDIHAYTAGRGEKIRERASEAGVTLCESNAKLAAACGVLLSTVTADQAEVAAQQTVPHLTQQHIYADLNSISPSLKQYIARLIEMSGARFVEIAIMSPVRPHQHRVPMPRGGPHAQQWVSLFAPFGMKLEIISDQIGTASATKMCRSIVVKGLEALLFECVLAAVPYEADERVFASLEETMPGMNWKRLASYMIGRVIEHGERRARELEEVAETLRCIGVGPVMTEAAAKRQAWGAGLNLLAQFGGKPPEDYRAVVEAIAQRATHEH